MREHTGDGDRAGRARAYVFSDAGDAKTAKQSMQLHAGPRCARKCSAQADRRWILST